MVAQRHCLTVDGHAAGVEANGRAVDEALRKAIGASEQPYRSIRRERCRLGVEHDRRRVCRRLPALCHGAIGGCTGRILIGSDDHRGAASPNNWPSDGGVSRASSRRKMSNAGSTCSMSGGSGVSMRNVVLGPVSDTFASTCLPVVWTTTGTSTANGAPGCVCEIALDDVGPAGGVRRYRPANLPPARPVPRSTSEFRVRRSAFGLRRSAFAVRRSSRDRHRECRRVRPFDPVCEESAVILAAHCLHRPAHVVERGTLPLKSR